jgi:hypothetical protein
MNFFTGIAFLVVWGTMYYFVFEMKHLEDLLKAENQQESLGRQITTKRQFIAVYALFLVGNGASTLIQLTF